MNAQILEFPVGPAVDVSRAAASNGFDRPVEVSRRVWNSIGIDPEDHSTRGGWSRLHSLLAGAYEARRVGQSRLAWGFGPLVGLAFSLTYRAGGEVLIDLAAAACV